MPNPLTGVGVILRPEKVVCSKTRPERAMLFLNVPADREIVSLFFSRSEGARCYEVRV